MVIIIITKWMHTVTVVVACNFNNFSWYIFLFVKITIKLYYRWEMKDTIECANRRPSILQCCTIFLITIKIKWVSYLFNKGLALLFSLKTFTFARKRRKRQIVTWHKGCLANKLNCKFNQTSKWVRKRERKKRERKKVNFMS